MGAHHFTAGYSNLVLIISAISHQIWLDFFFFPFSPFGHSEVFFPRGSCVFVYCGQKISHLIRVLRIFMSACFVSIHPLAYIFLIVSHFICIIRPICWCPPVQAWRADRVCMFIQLSRGLSCVWLHRRSHTHSLTSSRNDVCVPITKPATSPIQCCFTCKNLLASLESVIEIWEIIWISYFLRFNMSRM